MIAGKINVTSNDGKVAAGRVQNGSHGRWVGFSAEWRVKDWSVGFTTGTEGLQPARMAQLAEKVASSLGKPKAEA